MNITPGVTRIQRVVNKMHLIFGDCIDDFRKSSIILLHPRFGIFNGLITFSSVSVNAEHFDGT